MSAKTSFKVGDVVWLEENNWCAERTSVSIEKIFKDGNVNLRETYTGARRMSHLKNLTAKQESSPAAGAAETLISVFPNKGHDAP